MRADDDANAVLRVAVETLSSELRATEIALVHWRAHAGRLHAQVRALQRSPELDTSGAPRSMLPLAHVPAPQRPRGDSVSSINSFFSTSTCRAGRSRAAEPVPAPPAADFLVSLQSNIQHMLNPKEAEAAARRERSATRLQASWRGARQRRLFCAARAFYGIVNGVVDLRSAGRTVPAYTITVVRGGRCWQVSHRFSDWLELDRQLAAKLPPRCPRPALPSRMPWRSSSLTTYRQFALNAYLQGVLPLASHEAGGFPAARRLLLHFLSRSHVHWLYAGDASVPFTPPTDLVVLRQQEDLARRLARSRGRPSGSGDGSGGSRRGGGSRSGSAGRHRNGYASPHFYDGDVRDVSSGGTPMSAAVGGGPGRRSPIPRN